MSPLEEDEGIYALALGLRSKVLYVGDSFETMGGKPHVVLAAVDAQSGRVLDWNPPTHGGIVCAVALSPDSTRLYFGDGCSDSGELGVAKTARVR